MRIFLLVSQPSGAPLKPGVLQMLKVVGIRLALLLLAFGAEDPASGALAVGACDDAAPRPLGPALLRACGRAALEEAAAALGLGGTALARAGDSDGGGDSSSGSSPGKRGTPCGGATALTGTA